MASNKPSAKAQRTVGCHKSHRGAAGLTAVKLGENFAMIVWLFGKAQTIKKRRARLAGAGVLSSAGTVRI